MNEWNQKRIESLIREEGTGCVYLYTPFCGTCQVASKMLSVVEEMLPQLTIGKINLNYEQSLAQEWQIESVPCLVFINKGKVETKIYTFQSVPYLIETIKTTLRL
ncbi:thioredoxin family protein [Niallia sp. XMNu-256]|uniref:thioredoxin family protein n=1 Tax=Niallia sp. XMNu-256 TaxID=3082444 RepID=UPI0030CDDFE0